MYWSTAEPPKEPPREVSERDMGEELARESRLLEVDGLLRPARRGLCEELDRQPKGPNDILVAGKRLPARKRRHRR